MSDTRNHPVDLSPYLNRDTSDSRYSEIRSHVEQCVTSREEVRVFQAMDGMFRRGDEIEVPPFQWQRIAAQMQTGPSNRFASLWYFLQPRRPVWSAILAASVLGAALWTGLAYHKNSEEKQLLTAISRYASVEESKTGPEENPFRTQTAADQANESNPFAVRR